MRKLASLRRIKHLGPIEGADRIEVATIDGWQVVVKKGEFVVGDLCVYFEIDSWVPHKIAPFLTGLGKDPRVYKGVQGQRLKTIKLKGQISQGLALHSSILEEDTAVSFFNESERWAISLYRENGSLIEHLFEGDDLTERLGVLKWEPEEPEPQQASKGKKVWTAKSFPTHLFPKTDQERIQNVFDRIPEDETYEITVKLDGSSCSIFRLNGKLRVCSRNLEIPIVVKDDGPWTRLWKRLLKKPVQYCNTSNQFVAAALEVADDIHEGFCYQGELCGPSIQNNYEILDRNRFFVYDIVDMSTREYLRPSARRVKVLDSNFLLHVPLKHTKGSRPASVAEAIADADSTRSINRSDAEGLVYKSNESSFSFKAISNNYLLYKEENQLD